MHASGQGGQQTGHQSSPNKPGVSKVLKRKPRQTAKHASGQACPDRARLRCSQCWRTVPVGNKTSPITPPPSHTPQWPHTRTQPLTRTHARTHTHKPTHMHKHTHAHAGMHTHHACLAGSASLTDGFSEEVLSPHKPRQSTNRADQCAQKLGESWLSSVETRVQRVQQV